MDLKRIAVLMSTYNGEKYLAEQLESCLQQKDVAVDILVRDDGSKDGTVSLLALYDFDNNTNPHLYTQIACIFETQSNEQSYLHTNIVAKNEPLSTNHASKFHPKQIL